LKISIDSKHFNYISLNLHHLSMLRYYLSAEVMNFF